jgi:hypothetical protein
MAGSPRGQSGQVLVLVAVAILALVGITALALLAGSAAWQRNQLQALADSAALDAAMKIDLGCTGAGASTVITEADNFLATQRTRSGSLAITAGTCATAYHGTDTFAGGLSADYYWPYKAHQQQVEVVLTLSLPISFGNEVGRASTTLTRYAVAQALPASMPAISATSLACTGGQVNVAGDVLAGSAITLSGGCALYAHERTASGAYSSFGNIRDYTDGQSWAGVGGACSAGATSGSSNALCSDGYSIAGHTAPACAGATDYLSAANLAVNPDPCAAGTGRVPVTPVPSTLPPDPNTDPAAIATLQGTGGAACSSAAVYSNIVAGGVTWGTGQAPVPTLDAQGFWHFKPSCYGYLNLTNAAGAGVISLRQSGPESATATHFLTATLPAPSAIGTLLVFTLNSDPTPNKTTPPAGWQLAADNSVAGEGRSEIWYYPSNPGGISSVTFSTNPANINGNVQLSEWNGVLAAAPLDQIGVQSISVATTNGTVSTAGATAQANELVITNMGFRISAGQTYTRGASWNALLGDATNGFGSEYRTDLPAAVASESVTTSQASLWSNAIATFKPSGVGAGGAVLDPGFYYFNGSGFAGGGGICLNGGELLARDVTLEFVNSAGFSSGNCVLGGTTLCIIASCQLGSDPAGGKVDTNYTWFASPCSKDPTASPDASCLGGSSWCPAGDRACWNLLIYAPAAASGQIALKGTSVEHWLLGSIFWPGTVTDTVNGTSTIAGAIACGPLSISAAAGSTSAVGGDYGISTATVEAVLVE